MTSDDLSTLKMVRDALFAAHEQIGVHTSATCVLCNIEVSQSALDALIARMEQNTAPDITKCPKCGGVADNGHDRELPPNPYWCTKCTQTQNTGKCPQCRKPQRWFGDKYAFCVHGEQNGSASAIDGEKREHISAPIAGANPATPATTKDDGLLPDDEWSGLIRNPHLGIPPLPNDVLIDWHDFKKLRKAAEQPAAPQVAGIIADMERTITVTLPLTARDVLAYLLDDLRKQMGFNARGEKK